jgi:Bax protein
MRFLIPLTLVGLAAILFPMEDTAAPRDSMVTELVFTEVDIYHPAAVALGQVENLDAPEFSEIRHAPDRKQAFYDFMVPMINAANEEVRKERRWVGQLAMRLLEGGVLIDEERADLTRIERRYRLRDQSDLSDAERLGELLKRVDTVPASLVVAQAAKESGWGTSRFATEANNYFGIWCFYEGCGVTPLRRKVGLSHEVATFPDVNQSVRYYVRTLNTHSAYEGFREMRAEGRLNNQPVSGERLANGLERYSERGFAYVEEIQSLIRYNNLARFNAEDQA